METDTAKLGLSYNTKEVNKSIREINKSIVKTMTEAFNKQNEEFISTLNLEESTIFIDNRGKKKEDIITPHYLFGVIINERAKDYQQTELLRHYFNVFYHDIGQYLYLATKDKDLITYHFRKNKYDSVRVNVQSMTIRIVLKYNHIKISLKYSKVVKEYDRYVELNQSELDYLFSNINS